MRKHVHVYRRLGPPLMLALFLLCLSTPIASAASFHSQRGVSLVGPKKYYLALGDSLAFSYQPDLNYDDGYVDDFYANLQGHGTQHLANMGCPGETSSTFINGGCPYAFLRKFPYIGPQLNAALIYLQLHRGSVSPVTLDIGANDLLPDINTKTCTISSSFSSDLATVDANLTQTILPELRAALTVNGQVTGDLIVMNYYDPYQNICPNTVPYVQLINQHIANDISGYGLLVDVFSAFGGAGVPNPNICPYTWMCSLFHDIHATDAGYRVIASAFENTVGY
ncbi:MAG TPA: SGNH/GDSL hydrolase family protein [Ktedonobacteraceae bacterium]|jgi:lysophospholipase L1-like esterase|nr:SGNH/GDSL hydrolase family protein [Ktedonobacteraceae bacterium]